METEQKGNIIVVSNRSPYDFDRGEVKRGSGGLIQALEPTIGAQSPWIGISRGRDDFRRANEEHRIALSNLTMRKVFVRETTYRHYYNEFANAFIWPLMHLDTRRLDKEVDEFPTPFLQQSGFSYYRLVNNTFAGVVMEEALSLQEKNTAMPNVWIHDYHFMDLANRLRRTFKAYGTHAPRIGQTWHIPWVRAEFVEELFDPESAEWQALAYLTKAMLANDLITFHTKRYADNFMATAELFNVTGPCARTNTGWRMRIDERVVDIQALPIGVDGEAIIEETARTRHRGRSQKVVAFTRHHKRKGRRVFVGLERLDYTKGILTRLDIVEKLQKRGGNVAYLGFAQPSRGEIPAYKQLRKAVLEKEKVLNMELPCGGHGPVLIDIDRGIKSPANYILLKHADVCMVTTLSDGMNLVVLEAILSKASLPPEERGIVVIGICGAGDALHNYGTEDGLVRLSDPLDVEKSVQEIEEVLDQNKHISDRLIEYVRKNHNVTDWSASFMNMLR